MLLSDNYDFEDLYDEVELLDWVKDNYYPGDIIDVDMSWA